MDCIRRIDRSNYTRFEDMIYWRETGTERTPTAAPICAQVQKELENPNLTVYAAEVEGRFVAWISLVYIPKVGKWGGHGHLYVDELWVAPPYRRQGLAKALLSAADETARRYHAHGLRLYVNTDNPKAEQLYISCGFTPDGTAHFLQKTID